MGWRVRLDPLIRFGLIGYRMYVGREDHDGSITVMTQPVLLKTLERGSFVPEEDAFLDDSKHSHSVDVRQFLQGMADAAWEIGVYPKQLQDHSSELKATKYHLEDMRKIVLEKKE